MLRPLALSLLLLPVAATAQPTASDVFEEVERRQNLVDTEAASIRMEIVDERGRTRTRSLDVRSKTDGDRLKSILVFTEPADIRGMGLLTVETESGADDQKLYLPALGRVQRIAGSQRTERFAGSDFTYEDLGTRDPDAYDVTMAETTDDAFVLDARPTGDSDYSRIVLTVDRERYVVRRAEHYDRNGEPAKVLTAEDFTEVAPGAWRADVLTMEDVQAGRRTVLTFTERATGTTLRDALFTERQLQRGLR